jgi:uncharacterized protein (TIGR01777 family)
VHLAGESISGDPWTEGKRASIRASRVDATRRLAVHLASLRRRPRVLVGASAVGYYGDRGAVVLDETAGVGEGFWPSVVADWEAAAEPARAAGIRVVHARLGVVLGRGGGTLSALVQGLTDRGEGTWGDGTQYVSWVSLDDAVRALILMVGDDRLSGPANVVAPTATTQATLSNAVSRAVGTHAGEPIPGPVLRARWGPFADEVLLASRRAGSRRLSNHHFRFRDRDLDLLLSRLVDGQPLRLVSRSHRRPVHEIARAGPLGAAC